MSGPSVVVAGTDDHDVAAAVQAAGDTVSGVDVANRPALEDAGIVDAETFLLTEVAQATSIAVAKDLNTELKIVVYAEGSLPDFVRGQADLILDPDLFEPTEVAEVVPG
jgi:hypothetical protein